MARLKESQGLFSGDKIKYDGEILEIVYFPNKRSILAVDKNGKNIKIPLRMAKPVKPE